MTCTYEIRKEIEPLCAASDLETNSFYSHQMVFIFFAIRLETIAIRLEAVLYLFASPRALPHVEVAGGVLQDRLIGILPESRRTPVVGDETGHDH